MTVLTPLLDLPDVAGALDDARRAVDSVLAERSLRRTGGQIAAEASLRCAQASAALEGSEIALDEVRSGTVTDPLVQGCLRVTEALPALVDTWLRAPGQVLARLHLLAARGLVSDDRLGRPVA
ncbi:MAG: oxidoreductase, partial [Actinocatenispora sp.]